jgi:hypothetical protein
MLLRLVLIVALLLPVAPTIGQTVPPPDEPTAVEPDAPQGGSGGNPAVWIAIGLIAGLVLILVALNGDGGAAFLPPA